MVASLIRILVLAGLVFGGFKLYPYYQPIIQKQLDKPQVLGETVGPVIDKINSVLPDNVQIPTPADSATSENKSIEIPPAIQQAIDEIKLKTTEITNQQLEMIKKEASKQFCSALVEKIKAECPTE